MKIRLNFFLSLTGLFFIGSAIGAKQKLSDAIDHNKVEVIRELLAQDSTLADELLIPGEKLTPLHLAAMGGNVDIVSLLLDKKPKVDAHDKLGMTPLHYAVQEGHVKVVKLLLANGANKNIKSILNETPLSIAQHIKNNDIIALLANEIKITVPIEHPPWEKPNSKKQVETNNNLQKKLSTIKNNLEQLKNKLIELKESLHRLQNILKTKT